MDIGEKTLPKSIPWNVANNLDFNVYNDSYKNLDLLNTNSQKRIKNNKFFEYTKQYVKALKQKQVENIQTLNFKKAKLEQQNLQKDSEILKSLQKESKSFNVISILNEPNLNNKKDWITDLKKDAYLNEALNILADQTSKQQ
jgi:hypothetical protein